MNAKDLESEDKAPLFIMTPETVIGWENENIGPTKADFYKEECLFENVDRRYKLYFDKKGTYIELINILRGKLKRSIKDIILYKMEEIDFTYELCKV